MVCFIKEKDLFAIVLPTGMTHSIWSSWVFMQNLATVLLLSHAKWPSFNQFTMPWKYADGCIAWFHFFFRHLLSLFILFWSCFRINPRIHNVPSFLNWSKFYFSKCNIKEYKYNNLFQYSLTVSKGISFQFIYCSCNPYYFSSTTISLNKLAKSFGLYTCFFVDMTYLLSLLKPKIAL